MDQALKQIRIINTSSNFERERLLHPFGFKGGYLTELWQTAVQMESGSGHSAIGLGTQSVLYGDADLFAGVSEAEGNAMMYLLSSTALSLVKDTPFTSPVRLLDKIVPEMMSIGKCITGKDSLNINFIYNSLIAVDNAAWLIYAAENGFKNFEGMIPADYKPALSHRNSKIAVLYQVSYNMPVERLQEAARNGYFVFKIKTGFPGSQEEMLQKDMERLTQIHQALKDYRTESTPDGKLIYTMDANGRYEKKEYLLRYLDHARKIGAFDQILFYEEPFNEQNEENVSDVGIRVAGDESVNNEEAALQRIEQGYTAFVLKGIAKTLSLSMKIATIARQHQIPCVCSDLTVNPVLIDWHKNLAARIAPFPGLNMGLMETNGDMNYCNWETMQSYHPLAGSSWTKVKNGVFELGDDFYQQSGGILMPIPHYQKMFSRNI